MKIGIGITTRNRPGRAEDTAHRIMKLMPPYEPDNWTSESIDWELVVVDDASDEPVTIEAPWVYVCRKDENLGVARAKNTCLELLDENDHIFLFDDDAYPIVENWWRPYVESPEPHLMYQFADLAGPRKLGDITKIYDGEDHTAYSGPRGVMLYIDANVVLPAVGGLDPIYGKWGFEHGDWSNRIYHAGLTSWRYADVAGSSELIHSMDEYEEIDRSVPTPERRSLARANARIHDERRDSGYKAFVPYSEELREISGDRDVVITHLYSSKPDPQRPTQQYEPGSLTPAADLLNSLKPTQPVVVITDSDVDGGRETSFFELVQSELAINVFFQRHLDSWRYLRDHPEIRWAWCVDATDVEMVNEPWEHMEPGIIYTGYEPVRATENNWLLRNHPTRRVQRYIRQHGRSQLLNPGVLGGDRHTLMDFLHDLMRYHDDTELHRFLGHEAKKADLGDMGAMQVVGHEHRDHLETGSKVVSKFRSFETEGPHWFRHK